MDAERWESRGKRLLRFDNGRSENVWAVAIPHEPSQGMWERIWIARDDGELGARIARLPQLEAAEQQRDRLLEARAVLSHAMSPRAHYEALKQLHEIAEAVQKESS